MKGTPIIIATHTDPLSGAIVEQHGYGDRLGWLEEHFYVARWPHADSPFHIGTGKCPRAAVAALIARGQPRRMAA